MSRIIGAVAIAVLLLNPVAYGQYVWQEVPINWVDITEAGTAVDFGDQIVTDPIPMGFTMPFFSVSVHSVRIGLSGFVGFEPGFGSPILDDPAARNVAVMYPYGLTIDPAHPVRYYADAANARFIVSWTQARLIGGPDHFTFQMVVHADGRIRFQYLVAVPEWQPGAMYLQSQLPDTSEVWVSEDGWPHDNLALEFARITGVPGGQAPLPETFVLAVYPNPFNPAATVSLTVHQAGRVRVALYDITGRLCRVLADDMLPAGSHRWRVDGSGLATGIYFVQAEGGAARRIQQVVLLK